MPVELLRTIEKTVEVTNKASDVNAYKEIVAGAEMIAKDLWSDMEAGKSIENNVSPREIGKEVWNSITSEMQDGIENISNYPRYIITRNESLEDRIHPITGVRFEKRVVELPTSERIEGVFPVFDYVFEAHIKEDLYLESDKIQFCECNRQLLEAIENDSSFKNIFSPDQIEQIREGVDIGDAPDGYVWHHDAEAGTLQLVDFEIHSKTGHTGGRYVWGGGKEYR